VNGAAVVNSTAAIFDSGTTQIVGDPAGIAKLFEAIDGAQSAGEGVYTSAFSSTTNQWTRIHITSIP
jgi:cathepsin D